MHRAPWIVMSIAALAACYAPPTIVLPPGTAPTAAQYAPVNESERGGLITYQNDVSDARRERFRADAYRKMYDACGGPYRIDAEWPQQDDTNNSVFWFIRFSCVPKAAPDSAKKSP